MRLGLDFADAIPDGWAPLEAVVVIKSIDENGVVRLSHTSTTGLSEWEAVGMLVWCLDGHRDRLRDTNE